MIEVLRRIFPPPERGIGIGDDAAILETNGPLVITTDMLVEDVDFTFRIPLRFIAARSLAANLSDLAAMGAVPLAWLLTLGVPSSVAERFESLIRAFSEEAKRFGLRLIGGDLSAAEKLIISITAFGSLPEGGRPLLRSDARAGERIYVSRPLGAAASGLKLLQSGWSVEESGTVVPPEGWTASYADREFAGAAIMRHISPEPEVDLGIRLSRIGEVGACIDVSDGLSTDLRHLCDASECGAAVDWDRIPAFADLRRSALRFGLDAEQAVLHGGEEYALLFTSTVREAEMSQKVGRAVYAIGTITSGREIVLRKGQREEILEGRGFDHFSSPGG